MAVVTILLVLAVLLVLSRRDLTAVAARRRLHLKRIGVPADAPRMILRPASRLARRPHRIAGVAAAALLLVIACGCGPSPIGRVVPGTESSARSPRIVSVSPSESLLIVVDTQDNDIHAIRVVELATGDRSDVDIKSLPAETWKDGRLGELKPQANPATFVTWQEERFSLELGSQRPCIVIDGGRMTVVPSRADLFGLPQMPLGSRVTAVEGEDWRITYTPRVRYDYDAKLAAIVAQRDGGPGRAVLRVPGDKRLEGGPNTFSPSPDGRYLAYVDSRRTPQNGAEVRHELFLADLKTGNRRRIAPLVEAEFVPWSRDGRRVYFANGDDGPPYSVRVVDADRVFGRR